MAMLFEIALILWLAGLFVLVLRLIARGKISLQGLFVTGVEDIGNVRPQLDRVQHFWITVFAIGFYAVDAILKGAGPNPRAPTMPDVPVALVYALAGSQAFYLFAKFGRNT